MLMSKHREEARAQGVDFPAYRRQGKGPISHNSLFQKLASGRREDVETARRFIRQSLVSNDEEGITLFISEETNRYVAGQEGVGGIH